MEAVAQEVLLPLVGGRYASLFVRLWQPEAPRATVFCIHGFTGNGSDFDYLASFLARNGYMVVCPDMLGRGRSSYLGPGAKYDVNLYFRCFRALQQFAGKENHFIGTSWGGTILLLSLYMMRARANKVVLNDVPMFGGPDVDGIRKDIVKDSEAVFDGRDEARAYVRSTRTYLGPVDDEVLERYVENKIVAVDGHYRLAYDPATTAGFDEMMGRQYDLFAVAAKLDARFLLMYGRDSKFIDREAIERARALRSDLWSVSNIDAGHPPSLMTLDQALLVLGFLTAA